jgi:hypothetical protein
MKILRLAALWAAGLSILSVPAAESLTIYRIGGADLPRPEMAEQAGVSFVQLDWGDVGGADLVLAEQMDADPGFIEPTLLEKSVNLAQNFREERGRIRTLDWIGWTVSPAEDDVMWDNDTTTVFLGDGHWTAHGTLWREIVFEFNGIFILDRVRWSPRERFIEDRFMESYRIGINDGDSFKDGTRDFKIGARLDTLDFDEVALETENTDGVVEVKLPATPVKLLLLEFRENKRGIWEIAELEIYGRGRAPNSTYESQVIDLGQPVTLGNITWGGDEDDGASVDIALRTGDDVDPNVYWRKTFRGDEVSRFNENGGHLTLKDYQGLRPTARGGVTHDTETWDFWSTAYDFTADSGAIGVSKPRQFVQFQVGIESTLSATGRLDYVQFEVSDPPIATNTIAEITPSMVPAGVPSPFTFKLLPILKPGDLGFDHIEISTPVLAEGIDAVRHGGVDVAFDVVRLDGAGFEVRIPRVDASRTHELVEIDFRASVYRYGTEFASRVYDGDRPLEVRQAVSAGDADVLDDSNTLSVALARVGNNTLNTLSLEPPAFSPNGDGVNDLLQIQAELLNLVGDVALRADLFDLAGRRVHQIIDDVAASGLFVRTWNGRDAKGDLVPPGLYIIRVELDTDGGLETISRTVSVVY